MQRQLKRLRYRPLYVFDVTDIPADILAFLERRISPTLGPLSIITDFLDRKSPRCTCCEIIGSSSTTVECATCKQRRHNECMVTSEQCGQCLCYQCKLPVQYSIGTECAQINCKTLGHEWCLIGRRICLRCAVKLPKCIECAMPVTRTKSVLCRGCETCQLCGRIDSSVYHCDCCRKQFCDLCASKTFGSSCVDCDPASYKAYNSHPSKPKKIE